MKKYKYEIYMSFKAGKSEHILSNSRNARKHLAENNATCVLVYKTGTCEVISRAETTIHGFVIAGAIKQK